MHTLQRHSSMSSYCWFVGSQCTEIISDDNDMADEIAQNCAYNRRKIEK